MISVFPEVEEFVAIGHSFLGYFSKPILRSSAA
jgi:hypothetical protein